MAVVWGHARRIIGCNWRDVSIMHVLRSELWMVVLVLYAPHHSFFFCFSAFCPPHENSSTAMGNSKVSLTARMQVRAGL